MWDGRFPLSNANRAALWQRYCGFLELDLNTFREIQTRLLLEQIRQLGRTPWGRNLFKGRTPRSEAAFRYRVPLTSFSDYLPLLQDERGGALPEAPAFWAQAPGPGGEVRRIPYTQRAYQRLLDNMVGAFILAAADRPGRVSLVKGDRVLHSLPPRPFVTGYVAEGLSKMPIFRGVTRHEKARAGEVRRRGANRNLAGALTEGFDLLVAEGGILHRLGEEWATQATAMSRRWLLRRPTALARATQAWARSRMAGRGPLPRDLWRPKGIVAWGTEHEVDAQLIAHCWGCQPLELFAIPEAGILAMQSWRKAAMTFLPYDAFLEFIPERERLRHQRNPRHRPPTLLIDELRPGERYEVVATSLLGGPFTRYRFGNFVRVVSLEDQEAGIAMPQIVVDGRSDDLIDIGGLVLLDAGTLSLALAGAGLRPSAWAARKEHWQGEPVLHLEIELPEPTDEVEYLAELVHRQLMSLDQNYQNMHTILGLRPVRVSVVAPGSLRETESKDVHGVPGALSEEVSANVNPSPRDAHGLIATGGGGR